MARLHVAPTRSNLLQIEESLKLAREGHEILSRKREVLTTELIHVAHDAAALQNQVWKLLEEAYRALEISRLTMGREHLEWAALSVRETIEVKVKLHGVMGVPLPSVESQALPPQMPYSLGDTTVTLDEAAGRFSRVLEDIPALAETMTAVWRLARELQKTQRRVNALQYIFIPQYEETLAFIESALEEREREETFRLKRLKSKTERTTASEPKTHEYTQPGAGSSAESSVYHDTGGGKLTSSEFG